MALKTDAGAIEVTDIQVWPLRNRDASRIKAMVSITYNHALRVSGCKLIDGAKGLFLSYPSEKKPGSDKYYPLFCVLERGISDKIQTQVIERYTNLIGVQA